MGEIPALVVEIKDGVELREEDIKRHIGAHLSAFKVPEFIWFRHDALPRNAAGKIVKAALRDEYQALAPASA